MAKTMSMNVTSENFGEDFQNKLQAALTSAFGEGTQVKFQDEGVSGEDDTKKKRIAELEAELASLKGGQVQEMAKKLSERDEAHKAKVVELEGVVKSKADEVVKLSEDLKKFHADLRVKEIDAIIGDAEKEGRLLPAHRETIRAMLQNADANKVVKFTQEGKEVEKSQWDMTVDYVKSFPMVVNFAEISGGAGGEAAGAGAPAKVTIGTNTYDVVDVELASEVEKFAQDNKISFDAAYIEVTNRKATSK